MPVLLFNVDDIVQCRLKGTINGTQFENMVHFRIKCSGISSVTLAPGIRDFFLNQLRAPISDQVVWNAIGMARVSPAPKTVEDVRNIVPLAGAATGECLPNQVCYLIKIVTGSHLKYRKGRMYLPGVVSTHFVDNNWTFTAVTQFNSIAGIIQSEFGVGGGTCLEWGVWSRGVHDTNWSPMVSINWTNYPCIQRGRRPDTF